MMKRFTHFLWLLPIGLLCLTGCGVSRHATVGNAPKSGSIQQLSLARLQERQGDSAAAEKMYRKVLKSHPGQSLARHRLGVISAREGNFKDAIDHFEAALEAGEESAEFYNDFGYACYLAGKLEHAETMLRTSLDLDFRNPSAHNNLGLVLGAMQRDEESLVHFRRAGSFADALNNMAWVHAQRGDLQEARKHYLMALDADRDMKNAAEALVALGQHSDRMERLARREQEVDQKLSSRNRILQASYEVEVPAKAEPVKRESVKRESVKRESVRREAVKREAVKAAEPVVSRNDAEARSARLRATTAALRSVPTVAPSLPHDIDGTEGVVYLSDMNEENADER